MGRASAINQNIRVGAPPKESGEVSPCYFLDRRVGQRRDGAVLPSPKKNSAKLPNKVDRKVGLETRPMGLIKVGQGDRPMGLPCRFPVVPWRVAFLPVSPPIRIEHASDATVIAVRRSKCQPLHFETRPVEF